MKDLKVKTNNLLSVIQYADLVGKTRGRIYQLIYEKDDRIKVVEIAGKTFIDSEKSAKVI